MCTFLAPANGISLFLFFFSQESLVLYAVAGLGGRGGGGQYKLPLLILVWYVVIENLPSLQDS